MDCGYSAVNPLSLAAEGGGRGKSLLFDENLPEDDFVIFKDMTTWRDGEMEKCKDLCRAAQIVHINIFISILGAHFDVP